MTYKKGKATKLSSYFISTEFDCKGSGCCSQTEIDAQLVTYLQKIRQHFGKPVVINSGYRCATHNKRIGGAPGSKHTQGSAADIVVSGVSPAEVAKYAESIGILGIGLYETAKDGFFVHIDTRKTKSFWYGQAEAYRSTFGGATANKELTTKVQILLPELAKGAKGEEVKTLQRLLASLGYSVGGFGADGDFGNATHNAVVAFQKKKALAADGIVGKATWSALLGV